MAYHLVVTSPFAHRHVGERIEEEAEVARILGSHHEKHVVKVAAPAKAADQAALAEPAELKKK